MLRIVRNVCTMSPINRDPAFKFFLDECSAVAGSRLHRSNIEKALTLLEEENTVPFIARYRRDQTGDIEVNDLYELQRKWNDFTGMIKLRTSRLAALEAAGRCDEDIRRAFFECVSKDELDDLYSTVKEVKTAKSELIKAFCVESIAADILSGKVKFAMVPTEAMEAARSSKYSVLEAVAYHCTTLISAEIDVKEHAKLQFTKYPTVVATTLTAAYKALAKSMNDNKNGLAKAEAGLSKGSKAAKGESEAQVSELTKYKDYHSVNRRLSQLAAHQLLAIRRGKEAGVLSISLSPDDIAKQNILRFIHSKYQFYPPQDYNPGSTGNKVHRIDVLMMACKEVVSRLCASLTKKQWKESITSAEVEAAVVFGTSLRPLLLTAPLREVVATKHNASSSSVLPSSSSSALAAKDSMVVLAVDPGFAHGHKWVVLSQGGAGCSNRVSSGIPAQGESTSILCYGKIFEKSHGGSSKDSHHSGSVASFKSSPLMLHSAAQLGELLSEFSVQVVAIGNGTGSREAQQLVSSAMEHVRQRWSSKKAASSSAAPSSDTDAAKEAKESHKRKHGEGSSTDGAVGAHSAAGACMGYVVVSEAGASVYSASERAREEFPPAVLDISYVGAVSIGRRLMDPLSELVKIQPSALGVGMYQHDLSDKGIAERLRNVVEDCVNVVGVDINTASADLLRYVSGLNEANVKEIIAHRTVDTGPAAAAAGSSKPVKVSSKTSKSSTTADAPGAAGRISSLAELRAIKGIGPKTFRNCAGFLRVYGGPEPLDATNIHPEDYELARVMMKIYVLDQKTRAAASDASAGEKKHKRLKTKSGALSSAAENAPSASSEVTSFWARYMAESGVADCNALTKAGDSQLALLRSKSVAELEQIWGWVLESGVLAAVAPELAPPTARQGADRAAPGGPMAGQPYMSYPKVLQNVPQDFQAAVEVGSVLKGVIRNVTTFGAFVDLGGVVIASAESAKQGGKGKASCDGLLHCSKYREFLNKKGAGGAAHQRTPSAMSAEIFVGREVMVKILTIEENADGHKASAGSHDKRRIGLDLVELL